MTAKERRKEARHGFYLDKGHTAGVQNRKQEESMRQNDGRENEGVQKTTGGKKPGFQNEIPGPDQ